MIRPAQPQDLPTILSLCAQARAIMRSDGNLEQWSGEYPDRDTIASDISKGYGHMVCRDDVPVGYFAFIPGPDPTYEVIEGEWLDGNPDYHVIHRIASSPSSHGVFHEIIGFALSQDPFIRIDTHRDNRIMQRLLLREGFLHCGVIHLLDGAPRLAYCRPL